MPGGSGGGEKTEQPSPKKLRQAREEGNVAKSRDFATGFLFLAGAAVIGWQGSAGADRVKLFTQRCLSVGAEPPGRLPALVVEIAQEGGLMLLQVLAPLLGTVFCLAIFLGIVQTGGLFTLKAMKFKLDKLNPINGLKNNFFSARAYVELLKSLAKLTVAGFLGYGVVRGSIRDIVMTLEIGTEHAVLMTHGLVGDLVKRIGAFLIVIGVFDFFYQRHTWWKGLMMSKQEVKDEYKQSEGDPQMKGKRKQMAKELLNQKGVQSVKQAKVVVTNPHEVAVALEYDPEEGMNAPQVLCKGERLIAQQIIEEARRYNIPIMQNIALAHSLNELEAGDEVPEDLYEAVAEVLNWVYAMAAGEEPGVEEPAADEWGADEEW